MALRVDFPTEQAYARIINGLRTTRLEAEITQNSLAEVLPVRGRAVSEWESGAIGPRYRSLFLWARALGRRVVIVDRGVVCLDVGRRPGEPWVVYEQRRLAAPLRERRIARRMRQSDVGDLICISRDSIGRWELARVPPRPMAKVAWVHAMGFSLDLMKVGPPDPRIRRGIGVVLKNPDLPLSRHHY